MDDESLTEEADKGAPAWVMTFADLMSLLMCFFVLMLSFSEMDAQRFKLLSGSMRDAFGVQAEIEAKMMPRGTSIITKEFTPGRPKPTALKTVRQFTINSNRNTLDVMNSEDGEGGPEQFAKDVDHIRKTLADEIAANKLNVDLEGSRIVIRITEQASFQSGSDYVRNSFVPVLDKIRGLLIDLPGAVSIAGHTDDVPISTARYRSNWDLSAARAVSVAHQLLRGSAIDPDRLVVTGHADTRPRVANDNAANRARNRRVEITVIRGGDDEQRNLPALSDGTTPGATL